MARHEDEVCFADRIDVVEEKRPECFDAVRDEAFAFQGDIRDLGLVAAVLTPRFDRCSGGSGEPYRCAFGLADDFAKYRRGEEAVDTDGDCFPYSRRCGVDVKMWLWRLVTQEVLTHLLPKRGLLYQLIGILKLW